MNVKQILFYTRPWEDDFHIGLARQLQEHYSGVPVRFITFFISSFRKVQKAGYEAVYFPDELRTVSGEELSDERFTEIDRQLYETGGANFNLMLHSERFLPPDAAEAEQFGRKHLIILDRLVTEGTLSISSMYDHFVYWLAGGLANARLGWHFAFVGCGAPAGRSLALKTPWATWERPGVSLEESNTLLLSSRASLSIPPHERISYMKPVVRRKKTFQERCRFFKEIRHDKRAGSYFWNTFITPAQWICEKLLPNRLYQKMFFYPEPAYAIKNIQEIEQIKQKYVYLPLHLEPEAVILMYSPWLRDQSEVIRLTAQSLPVGWKLLVKENPKMTGLRNPDFNKLVTAMPNVRLVAPTIHPEKLMRGAEAVVVLAGTSAIEARLMGKPAFCFGTPPFSVMLSGGDVAGRGLSLRTFFEKLQAGKGESLTTEQWRQWVSGTVDGDAEPLVVSETISSTQNIQRFVEYIQQCVCAV